MKDITFYNTNKACNTKLQLTKSSVEIKLSMATEKKQCKSNIVEIVFNYSIFELQQCFSIIFVKRSTQIARNGEVVFSLILSY